MIRNDTQFRTKEKGLEIEPYPSRGLRDEIRRVEAVAFEYLLLRLFACISLPGVCQTTELNYQHLAGIQRERKREDLLVMEEEPMERYLRCQGDGLGEDRPKMEERQESGCELEREEGNEGRREGEGRRPEDAIRVERFGAPQGSASIPYAG